MKRITIALGCLLASGVASASPVITGFTANIVPGNNFGTSVINSAFDAATARITNSSVTCGGIAGNSTFCTGPIATFTIMGTGLFSPTPFSADIDGTFASLVPGAGTIAINALNGGNPIPFTFSPGAFSKNIGTAIVAGTSDGNFTFTGTLGLSIAPQSSLSLPNSLTFTVGTASTVPEPGTAALLGCSLLGLGCLVRRLRA